jgi:hypothetical protein
MGGMKEHMLDLKVIYVDFWNFKRCTNLYLFVLQNIRIENAPVGIENIAGEE